MEKIINVPYVPGAIEFIRKYYKYYDFYISTGTPLDEIKIILEKRKINNFFKSVHGSPQSKNEHISRILSQKKYNHDEVIFVGDAKSDIEAALKNKIRIIFRIHKNNLFLTKSYNLIQIKNLIDLDKIIKKYIL